jgi:hypothetical protein
MLPLRLVLDTNVVVSAALKPDGLQRTVLLLALTNPRVYTFPWPSWRNTKTFWRVRNSESARAFSGSSSI